MKGKKALRWLLLILGVLVLGAGSYIVLAAELGGDSMVTFQRGLLNFLRATLGWQRAPLWLPAAILNLLLFALMALFARKKISWATALVAGGTGPAIGLFELIDQHFPYFAGQTAVADKLMIALLGNVVVWFAVALYMYAALGLAPLEGVISIVTGRLGRSFWIGKLLVDAAILLAGLLLNAPSAGKGLLNIVGINTVIATVLGGIGTQSFMMMLDYSGLLLPAGHLRRPLLP